MPVGAVISQGRVPVKVWSELADVEPQALDQLVNTANLPCVFKHIAVMPDVHLGIGATIGSVIPTKNAIIPAAVGVDIGCGMLAVKTQFDSAALEGRLKRIRENIERAIPLGPSQHHLPLKEAERWMGWKEFSNCHRAVQELAQKARAQLGTLGGGNHFIELCLDTEDRVWIMLHSGSRHIGKTLAERHIQAAKGLLRQTLQSLPDPNLAYLVKGTSEFQAYWHDLQWAQAYAYENRQLLLDLVLRATEKGLGGREAVVPELVVNCHHNYAAIERHFGEKVYITRKGAVKAAQGEMGIIPGSMGTRSFIVRGKGNAEAFDSCSHGAGRRMSRSEARRTFSAEDLCRQTAGVECRKDTGVVDEIPQAYKDIDVVMRHQSDLVEVVAELKQVLCVKG
ncbi:MAG: RtcB family protein [Nitrospirae bacterium]|nr:MAG: RtcB family protein [Nitrospirota bacterium]